MESRHGFDNGGMNSVYVAKAESVESDRMPAVLDVHAGSARVRRGLVKRDRLEKGVESSQLLWARPNR